jgi:hypothetical protein
MNKLEEGGGVGCGGEGVGGMAGWIERKEEGQNVKKKIMVMGRVDHDHDRV